MLCGSIPPGVAADFYCKLIRLAKEHKVKTLLDTDGEALARGIEAGPTVVKPNQQEAERLLNRALITRAHFLEAATRIKAMGAETVLLSSGRGANRGGWEANGRSAASAGGFGVADRRGRCDGGGVCVGDSQEERLRRRGPVGGGRRNGIRQTAGHELCDAGSIQRDVPEHRNPRLIRADSERPDIMEA